MNLSKFKLLIILSIISIPAYASGGDYGDILLFAFAIYLFPYIFGVLFVGKGKRFWFSGVSFLIYSISLAFGFVVGSDAAFLTSLFSPFILVLISIIKRYAKKTLICVQE